MRLRRDEEESLVPAENSILEKYGIRLLRWPTNGSGKMEKGKAVLPGE